MPTAEEQLRALPKADYVDDLLGASDDPHPRKTRRIEWVGEVNPLDVPYVQFGMIPGNTVFTPTQKRLIRMMAAKAKTRSHRIRVMEHEHRKARASGPHLSRTYVWEKANGYVCEVDYRDVDVLLGDPDVGHEFVDFDALEPGQRALPRVPAWLAKLAERRVEWVEQWREDVEVGSPCERPLVAKT